MEEPPPEDVAARWLAAMRRGDWSEAWRQTDRTEIPRRERQHRTGFVREPRHLRWGGGDFSGRTVLVWCEHGLGDTLQFLRFLPRLVALAREVHLMVQPPLVSFLQGAPGLGTVHNGWRDEPPPAHDVDIEVMELAYAFRTQPDTLPPPYPHFASQACGEFDDLRSRSGQRHIGLLWAASEWDTSRSLPLTALAPLLALPGHRFFSLQQGPAAHDPALAALDVESVSHRTADLPNAAAAMLALDAVVSVDGMPAHLAGTLGRPTFLLLKHEADWRWMEDRSDSPWYPSMRLFRQPAAGDWEGAVSAAAQALRRAR